MREAVGAQRTRHVIGQRRVVGRAQKAPETSHAAAGVPWRRSGVGSGSRQREIANGFPHGCPIARIPRQPLGIVVKRGMGERKWPVCGLWETEANAGSIDIGLALA